MSSCRFVFVVVVASAVVVVVAVVVSVVVVVAVGVVGFASAVVVVVVVVVSVVVVVVAVGAVCPVVRCVVAVSRALASAQTNAGNAPRRTPWRWPHAAGGAGGRR